MMGGQERAGERMVMYLMGVVSLHEKIEKRESKRCDAGDNHDGGITIFLPLICVDPTPVIACSLIAVRKYAICQGDGQCVRHCINNI